MTSEARVAANRRKAAKSTGPRTEAGKAAARRNALRHGLTAEQIVTFDESAEDFAAFHDELRATLDPADAVEEMLTERIILSAWRLRRASRTEAELYAARFRREGSWHCGHLGEAFEKAESYLQTLGRYETALDRALEKAYTMLERRQAKRRGETVVAPTVVQVVAEPEIAEAVAERSPHDGQFCETNPTATAAAESGPDRGAGGRATGARRFYETKPMTADSRELALSETAPEPVREIEMERPPN